MRYERKIKLTHISKNELENLIKLHPYHFQQEHMDRRVNNIYFDTFDFKHYCDNIDGVSKRQKFRIRWYGKDQEMALYPFFEIKNKINQLGTKKRFPLCQISIAELRNECTLRHLLVKNPKIPRNEKIELLMLKPQLINCYDRKYYISADRKFRLTLDHNIKFESYKTNYLSVNTSAFIKSDNKILELKYSPEYDDELVYITQNFPFRVTKSSKYICGIKLLFN